MLLQRTSTNLEQNCPKDTLKSEQYKGDLRALFFNMTCFDSYPFQIPYMQRQDSGMVELMEDFTSKIWFTYRKEFEEFKGTKLNTDCGWGCMIRSGQMILANALLIQKLTRHWRWKDHTRQVLTVDDIHEELKHRKIVKLFGDTNDEGSNPLSIHQMMAVAEETMKKKPGEWFGPTTTAYILQRAVKKHQNHELLQNLRVYVAKVNFVKVPA